MFEAFVYTRDRAVEIRCSKAFAELPLGWTMLSDMDDASFVLSANRFDFIILDVDTAEGSDMLTRLLLQDGDPKSVILAVSSAPVNAALLKMCYSAQVFYPVRPQNVEDALYKALPFAESLWAQLMPKAGELQEEESASAPEEVVIFHDGAVDLGAALIKTARASNGMFMSLRDILQNRHSLSVVAHERFASAIAAAGTMWYVNEVTDHFIGLQYIQPPSAGPTYLVAIALLLWLCAKSRRVQMDTTEVDEMLPISATPLL